jgi:hypothetical protein
MDSVGGYIELLWKGPSEGIAISTDGLSLAFWRAGSGIDTLILYNLKSKSEMRTWRIPDRYESDKSGWDLAFGPDGHTLYARTYDEPSRTPLKRVDISSGKITVVSPDCYAVAEAREAVYFIKASDTSRSLYRIATPAARSNLVAKRFGYDSLSRGGNPRWLVAQDYRTKEIAVVDTESETVKAVGRFDSAAVLSDGKMLMVSGPEMTVGNPLRKPAVPAENTKR